MATSVSLLDYSDRELLAILSEVSDEEGWASTQDVADVLGLDHKNPNNCVGVRFAWLRRFGALERNPKGHWRMTELGYALMSGELNSAQERILQSLDNTQMLSLMRVVSTRWRRLDPTSSVLVKREWTHGVLAQKAAVKATQVEVSATGQSTEGVTGGAVAA